MRPYLHYDPMATAAYAVDKSTIRCIYAIAAASVLRLGDLDITSAFTAERYNHDKPVYIRQLSRSNKRLTIPDRPIG